jgi:Dictyostelium (slime mold) repeat
MTGADDEAREDSRYGARTVTHSGSGVLVGGGRLGGHCREQREVPDLPHPPGRPGELSHHHGRSGGSRRAHRARRSPGGLSDAAGTVLCLPDHPPVDCNDGLACTVESCDPAGGGCLNVPTCADGNLCTLDFCGPRDGGQCVHAPKECGGAELCDPTTGNCLDPCAGVLCLPLDPCHVAGLCVAGICDDPVAPDGTPCDDGDCLTERDQCTAGICAGTAIIPVDSDGDGVADSCDLCPGDPDKTEPGVCDCCVPDWDNDGDGVPDCIDPCPVDNPDDADGDGCCDSAICESTGARTKSGSASRIPPPPTDPAPGGLRSVGFAYSVEILPPFVQASHRT